MPLNLTEITNDAVKVLIVGQQNPDIIEYGVRWVVGQANPVGERVKRVNGELFVGAATNLVANVGVDSQVVENSFDRIPIFNTKIVYINNNAMVERTVYFHSHYFAKEEGVEYEYSWVCEHQLEGYIRPIPWIDAAGHPIKFSYLSRYEASETAEGIARSVTGTTPWCSISRGNARKAARKNDGDGNNVDSKWGIMDLAEYHYHIVVPFEIEFATRHSQSIMPGVSDIPYSESHLLLYSGTSNEVVLTNAQANTYVIGQTVSVGTALGTYNVVRNRFVETITLDTPNAGEATIKLSGEPFEFTAGNFIFSFAWRSGFTNNLRASSGAYTANTVKYPISFRGYENPWGNVFKFVDGGKIYNHRLWVTENRSKYDDVSAVNGEFSLDYKPVGYLNAQVNGYGKELGHDKMYPYARLPISIGGGNNTYLCDFYYQDIENRTLLVGGFWPYGSNDGMFSWGCYSSLTHTHSTIGFRLSYRP